MQDKEEKSLNCFWCLVSVKSGGRVEIVAYEDPAAAASQLKKMREADLSFNGSLEHVNIIAKPKSRKRKVPEKEKEPAVDNVIAA